MAASYPLKIPELQFRKYLLSQFLQTRWLSAKGRQHESGYESD
jgi:hypothetical protein